MRMLFVKFSYTSLGHLVCRGFSFRTVISVRYLPKQPSFQMLMKVICRFLWTIRVSHTSSTSLNRRSVRNHHCDKSHSWPTASRSLKQFWLPCRCSIRIRQAFSRESRRRKYQQSQRPNRHRRDESAAAGIPSVRVSAFQ